MPQEVGLLRVRVGYDDGRQPAGGAQDSQNHQGDVGEGVNAEVWCSDVQLVVVCG